MNNEARHQGNVSLPYNPEEGLVFLADFALGLPEKLQSGGDARKARLVYGMYEVSYSRTGRLNC